MKTTHFLPIASLIGLMLTGAGCAPRSTGTDTREESNNPRPSVEANPDDVETPEAELTGWNTYNDDSETNFSISFDYPRDAKVVSGAGGEFARYDIRADGQEGDGIVVLVAKKDSPAAQELSMQMRASSAVIPVDETGTRTFGKIDELNFGPRSLYQPSGSAFAIVREDAEGGPYVAFVLDDRSENDLSVAIRVYESLRLVSKADEDK